MINGMLFVKTIVQFTKIINICTKKIPPSSTEIAQTSYLKTTK